MIFNAWTRAMIISVKGETRMRYDNITNEEWGEIKKYLDRNGDYDNKYPLNKVKQILKIIREKRELEAVTEDVELTKKKGRL